MGVEIVSRYHVTAAKISGDLDHHTAKGIRSAIDRAVSSVSPNLLILDFSEVTFMDSSGIGLIMGRYKIMNDLDGEVIVACPPPYIRKVLQIAGIDKLTRIVSDYSDIIRVYEKNSGCAIDENSPANISGSKGEKAKEDKKIEAKNS